MYGVPPDLDLSRFQGAKLVRIVLSESQVDFDFEPESSITVEGHWEVRDVAGERETVEVLRGGVVVATRVKPPRSIALEFDGGSILEIFDSSEQYESFSIQPGNIYV